MEPGFYAFNSVMGSGKTAVAAHKAKLHYSAGWPVFHTSTSGANRENAFSDSSTSMRAEIGGAAPLYPTLSSLA